MEYSQRGYRINSRDQSTKRETEREGEREGEGGRGREGGRDEIQRGSLIFC